MSPKFREGVKNMLAILFWGVLTYIIVSSFTNKIDELEERIEVLENPPAIEQVDETQEN